MNTRIVAIYLMSFFTLGSAAAQDIEYDDMYFTKKDRAKLVAQRSSERTVAMDTRSNDRYDEGDDINPTDSYSARNVNPEYTSRQQSQSAQADDENYYVNDFRYNTQNGYNNWNNNFNNWYNNPWYSSAYWGSSINGWNSPYYGSYYDMWGSPWANPYYRSGWSSSFSYHWGNSWNYGWGSNFYGGWANPWNSWAAWGPGYYHPYNSWYGRPTIVVVTNDNVRGPVYGKRTSRGNTVTRDVNTVNGRQPITGYRNTGSGSRSDGGARIRTNSSRESQYYQPTWRSESRQTTGTSNGNSGFDNSGSNSNGRMSSWDNNNSRSTWRQESNNSFSTPAPSRNSSFDSGSRSSGSSGGSGGGRSSRGRD